MRFVRGNTSRSGDYWTAEVGEGEKNEWRGNAFERLCLEHIPQIKKALGISGVHTEVYSWRTSTARELRGAQVDLLIDRKDGIVNLCEMKFSQKEYAIDKEEFAKIRNRIEAVRETIGAKRPIHLTIVTANGLAHNMYWNNVQSEITLDDLFTPA